MSRARGRIRLSRADCVLSPCKGTHRRSVCELARRPRGRGWLQIAPRVLRERAGCDHTRGLLSPRPRGWCCEGAALTGSRSRPFAWYRLRFEGLLRSWAMSRRATTVSRALAFKPLCEAPPCAHAHTGAAQASVCHVRPVEGNEHTT